MKFTLAYMGRNNVVHKFEHIETDDEADAKALQHSIAVDKYGGPINLYRGHIEPAPAHGVGDLVQVVVPERWGR